MGYLNNFYFVLEGAHLFRIPNHNILTRVKGYTLPPCGERECPREYLVGIDETIEEALEIITRNLKQSHRVPPLAIVRMYRGGKTTILKLLYEYFDLDNKNFLPIIISFNGNFERRTDESPINALIRMIACQFIDVTEFDMSNKFSCSEKDLIDFIRVTAKDLSVILFIDELNRLGAPVDALVSSFLKNYFLDIDGRYLVFPSHIVMNIYPGIVPSEPSKASPYYFECGGSDRSVEMIHMPRSTNKEKLRGMSPYCSALTDCQISLCAGIPSLVYTCLIPGEVRPREKVKKVFSGDYNFNNMISTADNRDKIICTFLSELRTGKRESSNLPHCFDGFADHMLEPEKKLDSFGKIVMENTII